MKTALIFILMLATICIAADEKVMLKVDGMTCNGCVNSVTAALNKIDGVKSADVTLTPGSAHVVYDNEKASPDKMIEAITALGYKASINYNSDRSTAQPEINSTASANPSMKKEDTSTARASNGCPIAAICKDAGTKPKCTTTASAVSIQTAPTAVNPDEKKVADHACITITQCKELNAFHEAMHPLHMALSDGDYDAIRAGYPELLAKARAVGEMKCDKSCVKDLSSFEKYRQNLLVSVDELGLACNQTDNKGLTVAFDKMHESYNKLSELAK